MTFPRFTAQAAGPAGWNAQQGFYIYRNRRLLVPGDWLRLGFQKEEHCKLARIQVDLPNSLDGEWHIDVKKSTARPPGPFATTQADRHRSPVSGRARSIVTEGRSSLGRFLASTRSSGSRLVKRGKIFYRVNREHPLVKQALAELGSRGERSRDAPADDRGDGPAPAHRARCLGEAGRAVDAIRELHPRRRSWQCSPASTSALRGSPVCPTKRRGRASWGWSPSTTSRNWSTSFEEVDQNDIGREQASTVRWTWLARSFSTCCAASRLQRPSRSARTLLLVAGMLKAKGDGQELDLEALVRDVESLCNVWVGAAVDARRREGPRGVAERASGSDRTGASGSATGASSRTSSTGRRGLIRRLDEISDEILGRLEDPESLGCLGSARHDRRPGPSRARRPTTSG